MPRKKRPQGSALGRAKRVTPKKKPGVRKKTTPARIRKPGTKTKRPQGSAKGRRNYMTRQPTQLPVDRPVPEPTIPTPFGIDDGEFPDYGGLQPLVEYPGGYYGEMDRRNRPQGSALGRSGYRRRRMMPTPL